MAAEVVAATLVVPSTVALVVVDLDLTEQSQMEEPQAVEQALQQPLHLVAAAVVVAVSKMEPLALVPQDTSAAAAAAEAALTALAVAHKVEQAETVAVAMSSSSQSKENQ